ncbi:MAG: nuclear transport factor 2 family protein [Elusimicrobiaceae bacterium]|nr:nuclear transport factor 2 family protein [Elusimicrobiaceae bacterium]
MKATLTVKKEILKTISDAMTAFVSRNTEKALSFYAKDKDVISIGSEGEVVMGLPRLKKTFIATHRQFEKLSFKAKAYEVSACGSVAWTSGVGIYNGVTGGKKFKLDGLFTFVFEKRNGRWLIMHSHYSVPAK